MKRLIIMLIASIMLCACGGKPTEESTLTEAEETQLVDETSKELNSRVDDISNQADSINNVADSLLNSLNSN